MIGKRVRNVFHPERFQGWGKATRYFEGWYFKVVSASKDLVYAFIPGLSFDVQGNGHAFVQVFDGVQKQSVYHRFPIADFSSAQNAFDITLGRSHFSSQHISLDLPDVKGEIRFKSITPWPDKWYAPGIMGPYSFVPFMECKHGIVSLDHDLEGQLSVGNSLFDFGGGKGYIEKDWGRSFPDAYIWMQTNHFKVPGTSLKLSVAKIPWLGSWFVGFIGGLWFDGTLYQFTSYNGSRIKRCCITDTDVNICLENRKFKLMIYSLRDDATPLPAPKLGDMSEHIKESLSASVKVELLEKKGNQVIFSDLGHVAGFEVAGNIGDLQRTI